MPIFCQNISLWGQNGLCASYRREAFLFNLVERKNCEIKGLNSLYVEPYSKKKPVNELFRQNLNMAEVTFFWPDLGMTVLYYGFLCKILKKRHGIAMFLENRGFLTKYGHESKFLFLEKKKTWDHRFLRECFLIKYGHESNVF